MNMIERVGAAWIDEERRWICRRKIDKTGQEIVRDSDPDGPITDTSLVVILDLPSVSYNDADKKFEAVRQNACVCAAIKAMREPTEAMQNSARDWSVKKYGIGVGFDGTKGCWQSMIDAALEESADAPIS